MSPPHEASLALTRPAGGAWRRAFVASVRTTGPHWILIALYAAAAVWAAMRFDAPLTQYLVDYAPVIGWLAVLGFALGLLALLVRVAVVDNERRPARRLLRELRQYWTPGIAAQAIVLLMTVVVMEDLFAFFKPLIPRFVPFSWDPTLAGADRAIFFGHDPWELIWPVAGNPFVTWVLSTAYTLWFFWMLLVWVLVAFATRHRTENVRYFFATLIAWIVGGTLVATLFSSVGPCYFGNFEFGPNPFAQQMAGLYRINDSMPIYSLGVQQVLWAGQANPVPGTLAGISAFPSMHVAAAVLRTRIAFVHNRALGWISVALTALIVVGSVHLGWHYAVDGIAGAAIAFAAWHVAGPILSWWQRRFPPEAA